MHLEGVSSKKSIITGIDWDAEKGGGIAARFKRMYTHWILSSVQRERLSEQHS